MAAEAAEMVEKDVVVEKDAEAVAIKVAAAVVATKVEKDAKADLNVQEVHQVLVEAEKKVLLAAVVIRAVEAERKDLLAAATIRAVEVVKRKKHLEKVNSEINRTITL